MPTAPPFQDAVALHRAGRLAEAEAAYRAILAAEPSNAQALHLLGLLCAQRGNGEEGQALIGRAVRADPEMALAHFHRGGILAELGRRDEALASLAAAMALKPDIADIHFATGNVLLQLGRIEEAAAAFERASVLAPDNVEALLNLGSMLQELKRYDDALRACDRALVVAPDLPPALNNRGNTLRLMKRLDDALASFDKALSLKPDYLNAHHNRAAVLKDMGRFDDALVACDRVIALAPASADIHHMRGTVLLELRRADEAVASFDTAIALQPGLREAYHGRSRALVFSDRFAEALANSEQALLRDPQSAVAHNNRGAVLRKLGRFAEAKECFDRAIALQPDMAEGYFNRSGPLYEMGQLEAAHADTRRALALQPDFAEAAGFEFCLASHLCDWRDRARKRNAIERYCRQGRDIETFAFLHSVDDPALHLLAAEHAAAPIKPGITAAPSVEHQRLRVAYLSADFRDHPVAHQAVELFESHDRSAFETYGICLQSAPPSPVRERLRKAFDHFVEVQDRSDREIAQLLADFGIDIAVDLGGYTDKARPQILAYRPAPVSVGYLGYPGTLGAAYVDYIVADGCAIPPEDDAFYTEKVVRLPGSFLPHDGTMLDVGPSLSRSDYGLPAGFVFCNFNKSDKITPEIFDIWMRILRAVPDSILWLSVGNGTARKNLRTEAEARDVSAGRLIFAERVASRGQHLARLALADLFLDTLPYNAHATASDFLGAGVPVLTCMGRSFPARVAGSVLKSIGLEDLIVPDLAAYETLAVRLVRDPEKLAALRERVAAGRARISTRHLVRALESAYRAMISIHRAGDAPRSITVSE